MVYILQYSKTARQLSSSALDGALALLLLLLSSTLLTPANITHSWFGADIGMVLLLSMSAVAAACAVRPGSDGAFDASRGKKGV